MSHHDDNLYVGHMLDAARWIEQRLNGVSRSVFDDDEDLKFAIAHLLQIIGEAAGKVTDKTKNALPSIPWRQIIGMRHRIVHDYTRLNPDVIWTTATTDIRPLITELEKVAREPE